LLKYYGEGKSELRDYELNKVKIVVNVNGKRKSVGKRYFMGYNRRK
jgi:hypothetical protein